MRKFLTFASFVISSMGVMAVFITATTFQQLAFAIILYPILVYFAFRVFPRKVHSYAPKEPAGVIGSNLQVSNEPAKKLESVKTESFGIKDIDKRVFLKLIGGAGLSLFLFSIFNKKAEGLFFKNIPGPVAGKISLEDAAGNKIDPAQNQPTDGYNICEIDNNITAFYGYTDKDGAWYVMRVETETGAFRYCRGDSNFPGNWSNRENLKYDYFNNIF